MTDPKKHLSYQLKAIARLDAGISRMISELIPSTSTPFRALTQARSSLIASTGFRVPRSVTPLLKLFGLSPGTITLWLDDETGYFTESRLTPGAPPVYHHVSEDMAMVLIKGQLTHELEAELMQPDDYIGE